MRLRSRWRIPTRLAAIDVRSTHFDISQIQPDIHCAGKSIGGVTLQVKQQLVAATNENVVICIPGITLALAGIGLLGILCKWESFFLQWL